jgi:predicted S18 family serine protease
MNRDQLREAVLGTAAWKKAGFITESAAPVQEAEVIEEAKEESAVEAHTCPLCESTLEAELSDEVLLEHAEQMLTVFQEAEELLAEAEESEEGEVIEEEEVDLLEGLDEDEVEKVVAFVNEMYGKKKSMKAAKKGKKMEKEGEDC